MANRNASANIMYGNTIHYNTTKLLFIGKTSIFIMNSRRVTSAIDKGYQFFLPSSSTHANTPINPSNRNIKMSSFESNRNTQRHSMGHVAQFWILSPH